MLLMKCSVEQKRSLKRNTNQNPFRNEKRQDHDKLVIYEYPEVTGLFWNTAKTLDLLPSP